MRFALYKYGEEAPVGTSEWTQDGAEFPLIHVSINRSGRCRCCYLLVTDSPILALPSDSLELIIQGMQDAASEVTACRNILITIGRSSIFFLLLVLAFLGYRYTQAAVPVHQVS
ncbi:platelet glycoprotein VI-like isoform X1 [Phascolarctos cinereus]